jgi:hypothetical protein
MREINTTLLDNSTIGQHTSATAAALLSLPFIFHETGFAVRKLQCLTNIILQLKQERFDLGNLIV